MNLFIEIILYKFQILISIIVGALVAVSHAASTTINADTDELPPLKIDRNLRRALLKALEDLETESAEQKPDFLTAERLLKKLADRAESDSNLKAFENVSLVTEKLQQTDENLNEKKPKDSTNIETEKVIAKEAIQLVSQDQNKSVQADHENSIENLVKSKYTAKEESLSVSSSNGIVSQSANEITPSVISTTIRPLISQVTQTTSINTSETSTSPATSTTTIATPNNDVRIFQAPLVAAFTVQQDEQGVPKSVVPLYKSNSNNEQGLTLQEQIEFKQKLLERHLVELQKEQYQRTKFLLKHQQWYQEELKKHSQQHYLQELARLKELDERKRQEHLQQQQQQQLLIQQQQKLTLAKPIIEKNNYSPLLPPVQTSHGGHFQPKTPFELPIKTFVSNTFHPLQNKAVAEQFLNQQRFTQLHGQRHLPEIEQSISLDFQLPAQSQIPTRFNRQEAFSAIGNFGLNDNTQQTRNHIAQLEAPRYSAQQFTQFNQFQQQLPFQRSPQNPATQIQNLLFQAGVVGGLDTSRTNNNQEDLNIVSKVLALNVGATSNDRLKYTNNPFTL